MDAVLYCAYSLSRVGLFATPWTVAHQAPQSMGSSRKEYWSVFLPTQGIFPTQGLNPGLLHCRQILYQLSYQGSPTPDEADAIITLPSSLKMTRAFPGGPVIKTSPSNAGDVGLIPGRGAEISHALWSKTNKQTNIKQKPYFNKFNKE